MENPGIFSYVPRTSIMMPSKSKVKKSGKLPIKRSTSPSLNDSLLRSGAVAGDVSPSEYNSESEKELIEIPAGTYIDLVEIEVSDRLEALVAREQNLRLICNKLRLKRKDVRAIEKMENPTEGLLDHIGPTTTVEQLLNCLPCSDELTQVLRIHFIPASRRKQLLRTLSNEQFSRVVDQLNINKKWEQLANALSLTRKQVIDLEKEANPAKRLLDNFLTCTEKEFQQILEDANLGSIWSKENTCLCSGFSSLFEENNVELSFQFERPTHDLWESKGRIVFDNRNIVESLEQNIPLSFDYCSKLNIDSLQRQCLSCSDVSSLQISPINGYNAYLSSYLDNIQAVPMSVERYRNVQDSVPSSYFNRNLPNDEENYTPVIMYDTNNRSMNIIQRRVFNRIQICMSFTNLKDRSLQNSALPNTQSVNPEQDFDMINIENMFLTQYRNIHGSVPLLSSHLCVSHRNFLAPSSLLLLKDLNCQV